MLFESRILEREALAQLVCAARNAERALLQPAALGYIERPLVLSEAYVELSGALKRYDEAMQATADRGEGFQAVLDAFTCKCEKPDPDPLQVCRCCGSFVPEKAPDAGDSEGGELDVLGGVAA